MQPCIFAPRREAEYHMKRAALEPPTSPHVDADRILPSAKGEMLIVFVFERRKKQPQNLHCPALQNSKPQKSRAHRAAPSFPSPRSLPAACTLRRESFP